jgi:NAD(P)-dependent dehydrogenase (short-subunit alcohol dehydrogenase family)
MNPMPEGLLEIVAPLGRKGRVEDLTGLYVFLAPDESSYLTGQAISVDGGVTAGTSQALLRTLGRALRAEAVR